MCESQLGVCAGYLVPGPEEQTIWTQFCHLTGGKKPLTLPSPQRGEGDYRGVNMGTGGPPSVGVHTTRTGWPMRCASKSQSTRLVIMVGPSSSVT